MLPSDQPVDRARRQLIEDTLEELSWHSPAGMLRWIRQSSSGRLSLVNLHVLMHLSHEGPVPMSAIAEALGVSGASTTGIIDRMEERGLVERGRDESDRRVVKVALTEAGRQLMLGLATERRERLATLLEALDDDDLAALLRGSRALRHARERLMPAPATHESHQEHRTRR
jgi:DNA-binding MarR family transcriptional regulator